MASIRQSRGRLFLDYRLHGRRQRVSFQACRFTGEPQPLEGRSAPGRNDPQRWRRCGRAPLAPWASGRLRARRGFAGPHRSRRLSGRSRRRLCSPHSRSSGSASSRSAGEGPTSRPYVGLLTATCCRALAPTRSVRLLGLKFLICAPNYRCHAAGGRARSFCPRASTRSC